jgi:hypothetical protein
MIQRLGFRPPPPRELGMHLCWSVMEIKLNLHNPFSGKISPYVVRNSKKLAGAATVISCNCTLLKKHLYPVCQTVSIGLSILPNSNSNLSVQLATHLHATPKLRIRPVSFLRILMKYVISWRLDTKVSFFIASLGCETYILQAPETYAVPSPRL